LSEEKVSRRSWVKYAGAGVVVVAAAAGAGYYATLPKPTPTPTPTTPQPTTPTPTPKPTAPSELKIGTVFPMTGAMALLGLEQYRGTELACDLVNERGGIPGVGTKIKLVVGDAKSEASVAATEAERLITLEKVDILIGTYSSGLAYTASEVAEKYKKIYWEVGATADSIVERGYKYIFRPQVIASANQGALPPKFTEEVICPKMGKKPGEVNYAICTENTLWGRTVMAWGSKEAIARGFNLVATETYSYKATDLSAVITKLKAAAPDILHVAQYISDGILFWRQAKELDFNVKMMIGTGAAHGLPDFYEALGKDADYIMNFDPAPPGFFNPAGLTPEARELLDVYLKRWQAKYGRLPLTHSNMGFMHTWWLLTDVLPRCWKKYGSFDPDSIRLAALETDIPDGASTIIYGCKFAPPEHPWAGQNLRAHMVGMQWKDGKLNVVWPQKYAIVDFVFPLPTWKERKQKA
jgi:branched-chain amino acid transport system substrate-binding protein